MIIVIQPIPHHYTSMDTEGQFGGRNIQQWSNCSHTTHTSTLDHHRSVNAHVYFKGDRGKRCISCNSYLITLPSRTCGHHLRIDIYARTWPKLTQPSRSRSRPSWGCGHKLWIWLGVGWGVKAVSSAVIQLIPHHFTITGQWTPAVNFNGERGKRCSHTTHISSLYHQGH